MSAAYPGPSDEVLAVETVGYREEFYPRGFRKLFALMIIAAVTTLPPVIAWQNEPAEPVRGFPTGRYAPRGGFLPDGDDAAPSLLTRVWTGIKRLTAIAFTTAALMLYYPRRGFKRYALLCGPMIALAAPWVLSAYLSGRNEVYRAEIVLVAMAASLPGAAVYVWLTWRKAKRLGMEW